MKINEILSEIFLEYVDIISPGAGFLPSTVLEGFWHGLT